MQITKRDFALAGIAAAAVGAFHFHKNSKPDAGRSPVPSFREPAPPPYAPPERAEPQQDATVTESFVRTARDYPVVDALRRSVGMTEIDLAGGIQSQGSAILLDRQGTLALTAHQVDADRMTVRFLPRPDRKLRYCETEAVLIAADQKTDTSYWRLVDPAVIDRFGLEPVKWGRIGNGERRSGEIALSMGFPGNGDGLLDAAPHELADYHAHEIVMDEKMLPDGSRIRFPVSTFCKIEVTRALYHGNSGGGLFDSDSGAFLGIATAGGALTGDFTPADAIWNGYVNLVPAARGQRLINLKRAECEIGRPHVDSAARQPRRVAKAAPPRAARPDRRQFLFPGY